MRDIVITAIREDDDVYVFRVSVSESDGSTTHGVSLKRDDYARLNHDGETPEAFVERCFVFLLARESKEAILSRFDIDELTTYFPEFENEISAH
jgi:hypothetical protein